MRRLVNHRRSRRAGRIARRLAVTLTLAFTVVITAVAWQFHAGNKTVVLEIGCHCVFQVTGAIVEKMP